MRESHSGPSWQLKPQIRNTKTEQRARDRILHCHIELALVYVHYWAAAHQARTNVAEYNISQNFHISQNFSA